MNLLRLSLGKRRQIFEIQDFPWCPEAVRNGVTELLVLNLRILPLYKPTLKWLSRMAGMTDGKWVDLCAGAGGGSIHLKKMLGHEIKDLALTDLYPHKDLKNLPSDVRAVQESVDARNVPKELAGFRTLFTSFHHLSDEVALGILKDAQSSQTPIGIFEFTERNLFCLLAVLPSFFTSFFLVPFITPWTFSRFFWTYLIPLIPTVTLVDVILSCFRTRDLPELNALLSRLPKDDFEWEVGQMPTYGGLRITYLVGVPKKQIS
jgi:hypothetical protein